MAFRPFCLIKICIVLYWFPHDWFKRLSKQKLHNNYIPQQITKNSLWHCKLHNNSVYWQLNREKDFLWRNTDLGQTSKPGGWFSIGYISHDIWLGAFRPFCWKIKWSLNQQSRLYVVIERYMYYYVCLIWYIYYVCLIWYIYASIIYIYDDMFNCAQG